MSNLSENPQKVFGLAGATLAASVALSQIKRIQLTPTQNRAEYLYSDCGLHPRFNLHLESRPCRYWYVQQISLGVYTDRVAAVTPLLVSMGYIRLVSLFTWKTFAVDNWPNSVLLF